MTERVERCLQGSDKPFSPPETLAQQLGVPDTAIPEWLQALSTSLGKDGKPAEPQRVANFLQFKLDERRHP